MFIPWLDIEVSSYADFLWHVKAINRAKAAPLASFVLSSRSPKANDVKPEAPSDIKTSVPPRLWALIIGINDYVHPTPVLKKLKGAVPDANAMDEYLRTSLQVLPGQIFNLRDEHATRENIIAAFYKLRDNTEIQEGDPILIYYAGHGSEISTNGKKVQTLVPVEYLAGQTSPIPDRAVASLINSISKKHGNNITVIFDCCHSGSGTRGGEEEDGTIETLERGCEVSPDDVPEDLDADICEDYPENDSTTISRGMCFAQGFAVEGMNSHVLLAACSANERALEDNRSLEPHGRFTTALLRLFKEVPPDQMTYADVLKRISRIEGQNPQCEGFYRNRIIFDAKVHPPTRRCYDVKLLPAAKGKTESKCILAGGKAHGITDGAEFALYKDRAAALDGKPLGLMVARESNIKAFKSILEPVGNAPQLTVSAVAIQTRVGVSEDLLIHVPMEAQYMPVFEVIAEGMAGEGPDPCKITLVNKDQAKLEIVSHEDEEGQFRFSFNTFDPRATEHGFTRMPYSVDSDADDLHRVLRAAAHYNFHLHVNHPNNQIQGKITIDFFPLEVGYDDDLQVIHSPVEGVNLHNADVGRIEYFVDKDTAYGMRVTNNSPWDLHFSCFFFDHADFSITALTEIDTQTEFKKDFHLKQNSAAELGYGDLGVPPFECEVPEGWDVTIGFLKFYFTNTVEVIDLSHVPQLSPFSETRSLKPKGEVPRKSTDEPPVWGTILIPVIQKRKK